ncbi:MAG: hypothetical protein JNL90_06875 [Planctomycetes bacterium]|nr:hypothetical protein [Planctomycetota bacterium]
MQIHLSSSGEPALRLELSRRELPIFRAVLLRASFSDTPPEMQAAVFDLVEQLLAKLPDEA